MEFLDEALALEKREFGLSATEALDDENWPEYTLNDFDVRLAGSDTERISILEAGVGCPVDVTGVLEEVEEEYRSRVGTPGKVRAKDYKSKRILIKGVLQFSHGAGTPANVWAAGTAGWFYLQTPSKEYTAVHAHQLEAVQLWWLIQDMHVSHQATGSRKRKRTGSRITWQDVVAEVRVKMVSALSPADLVRKHHSFLMMNMLKHRVSRWDSIRWREQCIWYWLRSEFSNKVSAIEAKVLLQSTPAVGSTNLALPSVEAAPLPKAKKPKVDGGKAHRGSGNLKRSKQTGQRLTPNTLVVKPESSINRAPKGNSISQHFETSHRSASSSLGHGAASYQLGNRKSKSTSQKSMSPYQPQKGSLRGQFKASSTSLSQTSSAPTRRSPFEGPPSDVEDLLGGTLLADNTFALSQLADDPMVSNDPHLPTNEGSSVGSDCNLAPSQNSSSERSPRKRPIEETPLEALPLSKKSHLPSNQPPSGELTAHAFQLTPLTPITISRRGKSMSRSTSITSPSSAYSQSKNSLVVPSSSTPPTTQAQEHSSQTTHQSPHQSPYKKVQLIKTMPIPPAIQFLSDIRPSDRPSQSLSSLLKFNPNPASGSWECRVVGCSHLVRPKIGTANPGDKALFFLHGIKSHYEQHAERERQEMRIEDRREETRKAAVLAKGQIYKDEGYEGLMTAMLLALENAIAEVGYQIQLGQFVKDRIKEKQAKDSPSSTETSREGIVKAEEATSQLAAREYVDVAEAQEGVENQGEPADQAISDPPPIIEGENAQEGVEKQGEPANQAISDPPPLIEGEKAGDANNSPLAKKSGIADVEGLEDHEQPVSKRASLEPAAQGEASASSKHLAGTATTGITNEHTPQSCLSPQSTGVNGRPVLMVRLLLNPALLRNVEAAVDQAGYANNSPLAKKNGIADVEGPEDHEQSLYKTPSLEPAAQEKACSSSTHLAGTGTTGITNEHLPQTCLSPQSTGVNGRPVLMVKLVYNPALRRNMEDAVDRAGAENA